MKKRESQVGEIDQLKLKTVVFHGDQNCVIHITQLFGFVATKSVSVG